MRVDVHRIRRWRRQYRRQALVVFLLMTTLLLLLLTIGWEPLVGTGSSGLVIDPQSPIEKSYNLDPTGPSSRDAAAASVSPILSQPWQSVHHRQWCRLGSQATDKPGLIYVKIPKTASSTLAGINIRLARRIGKQQQQQHQPQPQEHAGNEWWRWSSSSPSPSSSTCSHTYTHGRTALLERSPPSLVWSFLRDPSDRTLSEFYHFEVSRKGIRPTDGWMRLYLQGRKHYQLSYLLDHPNPKQAIMSSLESLLMNTDDLENATTTKTTTTTTMDINVQHLLRHYIAPAYDFIGILERKDESLAVMTLLWDLAPEDVIILSAKTSGGYDDGRFNGSCIYIQSRPRPMSPFLQDYLAKDFQQETNNGDYTLYQWVNATLDQTIESLGRQRVAHQVQILQRLQVRAEVACQFNAIFPCSSNGTRQWEAAAQDCYWTDCGCGHRCVDRVLGA